MNANDGAPDPRRCEQDPLDRAASALFSSASSPLTGPFSSLWESNVVFADDSPDRAEAAAYIATAVERHRHSAEEFANALLSEAGRDERDRVTVALEESIVRLGLARAMVTNLGGDGRTDDEWHIGFAESQEDRGDDEGGADVLPPFFELPVTIALGVPLVDDDETLVRARDARVYREGLLVVVDVAVRRAEDMSPEEQGLLDHSLWDVLDEDEPVDSREASRLIASSSRVTTRVGVAQWDYWVPRPEVDAAGLRLRNPLAGGDANWHVTIDGAMIDEARAQVVDLRPLDPRDGRDTGI